MIVERHKWFYDWIKSKKNISQQELLAFHSRAGYGNREYGLRISRENNISTSSITSLCVQCRSAMYYHIDLIQQNESVFEYELLQLPDLMTLINQKSEVTEQD
jgi:hypothetical protein